MKHIIIGGDGFVGRHLARLLIERGAEVVIGGLTQSDLDIYRTAPFVRVDVRNPAEVAALPIRPDDVVYHLAARMLMPIMPRAQRYQYFHSVNHHGTENVLRVVYERGCSKMVYFTTDMVYGRTRAMPKTEDHPRAPLGPYGGSKLASEKLCESYRDKGVNVAIFRPRLIIGPGRLGILARLFRLIEANLPVPVIGNGRNHYQFISVFDCASAALAAADHGVPNGAYNLGSLDPPTVDELLRRLIEAAGSRSRLLHAPAILVKPALAALDLIGWPLMDPEQYLIADEDCIVDVAKAERELGWRPRFADADMLLAAYAEYREFKIAAAQGPEVGASGGRVSAEGSKTT
ncbi:MAG: NAD-dependent epimerase/dehydratase family protein [Geminicoccaceae bacterium]